MARLTEKEMCPMVAARRGGKAGLFILPIVSCKPTTPMSFDVLDQAALRAAFAGDDCDGKDRMAGASWSTAEGFAVLAALRRRQP